MTVRVPPPRVPHRPAAAVAALALAMALLAGSPAAAQTGDGPGEEFAGRERVTAVDLVVEAERGLDAGALAVAEDGAPRPVVAVEPAEDEEPWRLVVWFELPLAEPEGVRWAADELGARAEELVALGAVEVVVAGPEPRTALPPTRDAAELARALARIAEEARAGDELVRLRRAVARELAEIGPAGDPAERAELATTAAAEEARFVAERADALLLRLVETAAEPGIGARRALLLVASGWDLEPAGFYRARLAGGTEAPGSNSARSARGDAAGASERARGAPAEDVGAEWPEDARTATESLARALAGYGWITLALAPPVPREPEWHLRRRAQVALDGLHRPDAGEAYLELGRALAGQGELEKALEAYRDAIHAFYDHPASAARQAIAEAERGDVLARMGRQEEAERWWRQALQRDPALAARYPGAAAALTEPRAALSLLAEATAGRLVRDDPEKPGALDAALESLEKRIRITYQRPGAPDGALHPVTVQRAGREKPLPAPAWARSGTPEAVATARLRRFLEANSVEGATLPLRAAREPGDAVIIRLDPPAGPLTDPDHQPILRLSLATLEPNGEISVQHQPLAEAAFAPDEPWSHRLDPTPPHQPAAVLLEDLASGLWGITTIPPLPETR